MEMWDALSVHNLCKSSLASNRSYGMINSPTIKVHRNDFLLPSGDQLATPSSSPSPLISSYPSSASRKNALIILNSASVEECKSDLSVIWNNCDLRLCADGGGNRLFDMYAKDEDILREKFLPDQIRGDLDSLRPEVGDYYKRKGVPVIQDQDQDTNDLDKCMQSIVDGCADKEVLQVICLKNAILSYFQCR